MFQAFKDNPAAFGKDYLLTERLRNATGEVLYQSSSPEDYLAYVEWLADYLYTAKPQPSPRQQALCELAQSGPPEWAIQSIAMEGPFYDDGVLPIWVGLIEYRRRIGRELLRTRVTGAACAHAAARS